MVWIIEFMLCMIHVSFDSSMAARKVFKPTGSNPIRATKAIAMMPMAIATSGKLKPEEDVCDARLVGNSLCIRCIYNVPLPRQNFFSPFSSFPYTCPSRGRPAAPYWELA